MLMLAACAAACLGARPCDQDPLKGSPLCNEALSPQQRAYWIVQQLTLDEKGNMTQNTAMGVPRLGISDYQWWSEALHGVAMSPGVIFNGVTPVATSFPQVITTAASFNKTLFHTIGSAISTEARAFANSGHAGLTFWTPNINIMRDPRWGRGQETPGEDPYLTSRYAEMFVTGMQEGEDKKHIKASACCKHYYAYDLEDWGGVDRHSFDAVVGLQDEADTYFPAFHACVANARVTSLMCSYNAVNGVPSCANSRIMQDYARDAWGFEGYITSDCGAVEDVTSAHHFDTPNQAVRDTLGAGMDSDCGLFMDQHLKDSIKSNVTKLALLDRALEHLFAVQVRLGMFDSAESQPYLKYTYGEKVNTPAHQALALEAARQGTVLLKNDGTLPLSKSAFKTVAMVGPSANATNVMQANYQGIAPYLVSPNQGMQSYTQTIYAPGCENQACTDDSGFATATDAAKVADATVLVIGLSANLEGEANDRTDIALPGKQVDLVRQVADASKGPVIVVVLAGGSVDLTPLKTNDKVRAVVWCGYPGQSGGQAVADVIFGTFNPSGRLPHTQYPASYLEGLSMFDMGMRPNASTNNTGRSYRFYTREPVYSFGEGMSYTTFTSSIKASTGVDAWAVQQGAETANKIKAFTVTSSDLVITTVQVTVTNTGSIAGDRSVLLFAKPPGAGVNGAPKKFLVAFERVSLEAGASTTITIPLYYTAFSLVNSAGQHAVVNGQWTLAVDYNDAATATVTVA